MTSEIKGVHAFAGTGIHASLISALNLVIKYYCNAGSYSSDTLFFAALPYNFIVAMSY